MAVEMVLRSPGEVEGDEGQSDVSGPLVRLPGRQAIRE